MADTEDDEDSPFAIPQYRDASGRSLDFDLPVKSLLFANVNGDGTAARPGRVEQAQNHVEQSTPSVPAVSEVIDLSVLDIPELELPKIDLLDLQSSSALFNVALANFADLDVKEQSGQGGKNSSSLEDDFWTLPETLKPLKSDVRFLTWETFYDPNHKEATPRLASEAGSDVFNAALEFQASRNEHHSADAKIVKTTPLLRCLFELGIGRPSVLFKFDDSIGSFSVCLNELRASGYSYDSTKAIIDRFLAAGNAIRALRNVSELTAVDRESDVCCASLVSAIEFVLDACEDHIVRHLPPQPTLLSLKTAFDRQHGLILRIHNIVQNALSRGSGETILHSVITQLETESFGEDSLFLCFRALLKFIAKPWLSGIAEDIGISHVFAAPRISDEEEDIDLTLGSIDPPIPTEEPSQLLSPTDRELVRVAKRNLAFLKSYHPEHPLCQSQDHLGHQLGLSWEFDTDSIDLINAKAQFLVDRLQTAISQSHSNGKINVDSWNATNDIPSDFTNIQREDVDEIEASIRVLNQVPIVKIFDDASYLTSSTAEYLSGSGRTAEPPVKLGVPLLQSLRLSVRPFLELQHRLLSTEYAKAILTHHALREHLSLHHAFSLCASGLFTSRLSATLFSQEASSAERKRGVMRSSGYGIGFGLRLGTGERQSWPPASSEVRLALMGILSETWLSIKRGSEPSVTISGKHNGSDQTELPGGLSFSLRTSLSEAEIERVLDPNSIYALDFLRLSYTPPPALADIFTGACLAKYDRIFRFLLKMIRMQHTVSQVHLDMVDMFRRNDVNIRIDRKIVTRFKFQAAHFVNTVASFVYNVGINFHWQNLIAVLDRVEADLSRGELCFGDFTSLSAIHVQTLDSIMSALLLRKRQKAAASALEHIYSDILAFAWALRKRANKPVASAKPLNKQVEPSMPTLFESFREKAAVFAQELRKLGSSTETQTEPHGKIDDAVRESHLSLASQLSVVEPA